VLLEESPDILFMQETYLYKVIDDPDVQAYMKEHKLGEEVHELYRHFLLRMDAIVKKHGKQMGVWEQVEEVEIPSLRKRLPVLNERIWNTREKLSYEEFMDWMDKTDKILSRLMGDERQDSLLVGYNF
jgi:N-acetyl-beta-hexosaminidase